MYTIYTVQTVDSTMLTVHYNASVLYSVQYNPNYVIQYKLYRPCRARTLVHLYTCTFEHLYTCSFVHLYTCTLLHMYTFTLVHLYTCTVVRNVAISRLLYWNWETKWNTRKRLYIVLVNFQFLLVHKGN